MLRKSESQREQLRDKSLYKERLYLTDETMINFLKGCRSGFPMFSG